jgi:hypothetical protein
LYLFLVLLNVPSVSMKATLTMNGYEDLGMFF